MRVDVRRVVPDAGQARGRTVEDDSAAHEDEPLDELLDGSELVRHVEDRDRELAVQPVEQRRQRLLRLDVDARRRLVEHEQRRLPGKRLRDEGALLLPAGERPQRPPSDAREADAGDRLVDRVEIAAAQGSEQAAGREPSGRDDLAHRGRRVDAEARALREVADPLAARVVLRGLAVEQREAARRPLQAEHEPHERRLAAPVRPGHGDELAGGDAEVDVLQHVAAALVRERDAPQLDR